eukprot:970746-Heterocapsa_arctica.AAC.1
MESIASLLGCDGIMAEAIRDKDEPDMDLLSDDDAARSSFLYNLLVQMCHGRALAIIRLVKAANGMAAWKRLVGEYEPDLAGRHCAVLAGLLTPDWSGKAAFIDQLL